MANGIHGHIPILHINDDGHNIGNGRAQGGYDPLEDGSQEREEFEPMGGAVANPAEDTGVNMHGDPRIDKPTYIDDMNHRGGSQSLSVGGVAANLNPPVLASTVLVPNPTVNPVAGHDEGGDGDPRIDKSKHIDE